MPAGFWGAAATWGGAGGLAGGGVGADGCWAVGGRFLPLIGTRCLIPWLDRCFLTVIPGGGVFAGGRPYSTVGGGGCWAVRTGGAGTCGIGGEVGAACLCGLDGDTGGAAGWGATGGAARWDADLWTIWRGGDCRCWAILGVDDGAEGLAIGDGDAGGLAMGGGLGGRRLLMS